MTTFAGYRAVTLTDADSGMTFPLALLYPTVMPGKEERLGPYTLEVSLNAAPKASVAPLVVISHGTGGSPLVHRTLAQHLARNGYIVGLPEHPFNNRNDNSLEGTVENLVNRPRHLRTVIDWVYASEQFAPLVKLGAVAVIGHSMGGYTALAVAGGVPTALPHESPDDQPRQLSVVHDERVKALVLLAPAAVWFREADALREVTAPILMLFGTDDPHTPAEHHAQFILDGVSDRSKVDYRLVENAGHFAFQSIFPATMTRTITRYNWL